MEFRWNEPRARGLSLTWLLNKWDLLRMQASPELQQSPFNTSYLCLAWRVQLQDQLANLQLSSGLLCSSCYGCFHSQKKRNYDRKVDIFSMGLIFLELWWKVSSGSERAEVRPSHQLMISRRAGLSLCCSGDVFSLDGRFLMTPGVRSSQNSSHMISLRR